MYKKNATKPTTGKINVLRVIFGLADSVEYTIGFCTQQLTAEKMLSFQLYVLSISAALNSASGIWKLHQLD